MLATPLISDDTGTQGTGHWQFEVNTDHARTRNPGSNDWERQANVALSYGVKDNLDIAVNLPWLHNSSTASPSTDGLGDATLLAKWRFYDNSKGWTLALRPQITLPTGDETQGLGNGRASTSVTLISSYEAGDWTWLANAGLNYNNNNIGDRKQQWAVSTAVLWNVHEKWAVLADIGSNRSATVGAGPETTGVLGAIYHLNADTDIDVGLRRSIGSSPHTNTVGLGLTVRW